MPEATSNVIRFPIERRRRNEAELLYELMPDIRVVSANAEAFGFVLPDADLHDRADRVMAEYILNNVRPEPGYLRLAELDRGGNGALPASVGCGGNSVESRGTFRERSKGRLFECASGRRICDLGVARGDAASTRGL